MGTPKGQGLCCLQDTSMGGIRLTLLRVARLSKKALKALRKLKVTIGAAFLSWLDGAYRDLGIGDIFFLGKICLCVFTPTLGRVQ